MAERLRFIALLTVLLLCAAPRIAGAEWYFTPFVGPAFRGTTTFLDPEYGGRHRAKVTFGGSATVLKGVVGAEADYSFLLGFFQNPACDGSPPGGSCPSLGPLVTQSRLQTLTGNVLVAAPLSVTRESLRPYLVSGIGLLDVAVDDIRGVLPINTTLTVFNIGGGAIGMFGTRTGLRFDLRRFSSINRDVPSGTSIGGPARLHFWRATIGLTVRY